MILTSFIEHYITELTPTIDTDFYLHDAIVF